MSLVLNAAQREAAAALAWWAKDEIGEHPIVAYQEQNGELRVTVDHGVGGRRRFRHPLHDLTRILNAYRSEFGPPSQAAPRDEQGKVGRIEYPKRMELPEPVEYLTELDYLDEILELHDPGADLQQYVGREPRTLEHHLHHAGQAVEGEEHGND